MFEPTVAQLLDVLAAVRDALDVPIAAHPADREAELRLVRQRASDTKIIVRNLLQRTYAANAVGCSKQLRGWTAERPVTYEPRKVEEPLAAACTHGSDDLCEDCGACPCSVCETCSVCACMCTCAAKAGEPVPQVTQGGELSA